MHNKRTRSTRYQKAAEQRDAIARLRDWLKPGDTCYTILDHVSRSGMSRQIRLVVPYTREDGTVDHVHPNHAAATVLGMRRATRGDGIIVGGCGMDMGFHLVYELSHTLYGGRLVKDIYKASATHDEPGGQLLTRDGAPEGYVYLGGYACLGEKRCPSNYHVNHRDSLRCEGTRVHNPEGPDFGQYCYAPSSWRGEDVPDGWPRLAIRGIADGPPASCLTKDAEGNAIAPVICPACQGAGTIPNPERWDLVHTDGYAIRHQWL